MLRCNLPAQICDSGFPPAVWLSWTNDNQSGLDKDRRNMTSNQTALTISLLVVLSLAVVSPVCAQNAGPTDRNAVNTASRPSNMMADSPVVLPKKGALPSKYPPDLRVDREPVEKDYFLFGSPCRSLAQNEKIQSEMPTETFTPPAPDSTGNSTWILKQSR
jgi:hypothetical protein